MLIKIATPETTKGPVTFRSGAFVRREPQEGPGALAPTFFPSSLDLTDVCTVSGEVAKSSPLHGPVGARHFPISVWYQALATRKMHPRPNPVHSQISGASPAPVASACSSHCTRPSRLLPLDECCLDRRGGWLYPARPQHLRPRSRARPHHSQPQGPTPG